MIDKKHGPASGLIVPLLRCHGSELLPADSDYRELSYAVANPPSEKADLEMGDL